MRVRDPEDKKRRLLDAALAEFSERGLAGARIDALAARAQVSSGLVYAYFGSKVGLFDAVLEEIAAEMVESIPLDASDLPGYAVALFDAHNANPQIDRFVAWYRLERSLDDGGHTATADQVTQAKIRKVAEAQSNGAVTNHLSAEELVLAVQTIARSWFTLPAETLLAIDPAGDAKARRQMVRRTVAQLVRP